MKSTKLVGHRTWEWIVVKVGETYTFENPNITGKVAKISRHHSGGVEIMVQTPEKLIACYNGMTTVDA